MMEQRHPELFDAIRDYLLFAQQWLKSHGARRGVFARIDDEQDFVGWLNGELRETPQYQLCVLTLKSNPVISAHLNGIGVEGKQWMLFSEWHFMRSILFFCVKDGQFVFDEKRLREKYLYLEEAFFSDYVRCEVIAPIFGLVSESDIELAENLEIGRITEEEKQAGYTLGVINENHSWRHDDLFVIRAKYKVRKILGPNTTWENERIKSPPTEPIKHEAYIKQIVEALRVFKKGSLYDGGIIHSIISWFLTGLASSHLSLARPTMFTGNYSLSSVDAENFRLFWEKYKEVHSRKALELALRRFSYSGERTRDEDKIVDLLIAAEALFLNDIGNESYRGELTYRMALRAGFFVGDGEGRKKIYQHMRKAYQVRSAIVHGSSSIPLPKRADGRQMGLSEFVGSTESVMRSALHKAIDIAIHQDSSSTLVHWDDFIFDN